MKVARSKYCRCRLRSLSSVYGCVIMVLTVSGSGMCIALYFGSVGGLYVHVVPFPYGIPYDSRSMVMACHSFRIAAAPAFSICSR